MPDPAEQQAAYVDLLTELLLQGLHPEPAPPQSALPADVEQVLERMGEAMAVMYGNRRR